jgi:hypothetical protein
MAYAPHVNVAAKPTVITSATSWADRGGESNHQLTTAIAKAIVTGVMGEPSLPHPARRGSAYPQGRRSSPA